MSDSLKGKLVVVTGASRGIGLGTARAVAAQGAKVVIAARDEVALSSEAARGASEGLDLVAVPCDVADPDAVEKLFDQAEAIGPVDALICAAGVLVKANIVDTTREIWDRTLATNLSGAFHCSRRAFTSMQVAGGGKIVLISSLSGVYATEKFPGLGAYNVSKYGIVGLTESLAVEGRDHNIIAVCVSPGAVDTKMLRDAAPHLRAAIDGDAAGRLICKLLDDDLVAMSGANIPLFTNR